MFEYRRLTVAVWKFASCDGCQLTLLDCEDELFELLEAVRVDHFLEMTRARTPGPYDLSLVEGSITTPADVDRIADVRRQSRLLVTIGACAVGGGIQALRDKRDIGEMMGRVYEREPLAPPLARSTPISQHVDVDYQLPGCPIDKQQLLELIGALIAGRRPVIVEEPVCMECKRLGRACVAVCDDQACLGPLTRSGCGALCPAYDRGCYGCFGPLADVGYATVERLLASLDRSKRRAAEQALSSFNVSAFDRLRGLAEGSR